MAEYWGDRNPGDRIDWDISFVNTTGVPTALSSGSAFCRRLSTLTIAPAGVLFTASGGLNRVTIFTGSSSTFYVAGDDYSVVMAAGTISSNAVQDLCVGQFSIQNRNFLRPTTAGRTLTVAASGGVDLETIKTNPVVNAGTVTFPTTATLASTTNITAGTITTVTNLTNAATAGDLTATMKTSVTTAATAATPTAAAVTGSVGSVIATTSADVIQWRNVTPNALIAGRVDANGAAVTVSSRVLSMDPATIAAATFAAGALDAAALATDFVNEISDGMFARSLGTESYAADGAVPTFAQMQFMLWSVFAQFAIVTTTITTYSLDGTTPAMTFGMDNTADLASSRTRLT